MLAISVLLLMFLASYLLGAIPFGVLVARWRGVDILQRGSGNIGATNVGRVLGKKYGVLVFVLDFAKGALPVAVAWLLAPYISDLSAEALEVTAGVAAFLGHLFPVYLRFRGGKGVATGAGVVAVLVPLPALAAVLTWLGVVVITRYVSVASIFAAAMVCLVHFARIEQPWEPPHNIVSIFCLVAAGLVVVRHLGNLRRLVAGTENRFKESPTMMLFSKTLHVLALGLWFGSAVFFTLAGYLIFEEFKKDVAAADAKNELPAWFVMPEREAVNPVGTKDVELLNKERASRAFGTAVAPLFSWYYGIQLVSGFIAFGTALSWFKGREKDRVQIWRAWLLLMALLVTLGGWWLEGKVSELRQPRNNKTDLVLKTKNPSEGEKVDAELARNEFGKWHGYSLMQNLVTLLLVTAAMALAAQLPAAEQSAGTAEERNKVSTAKIPASI
jgi:acyl phosphate:glycerol-3-phosphate acyltransferase